jgi:hypothetical protein
MRILRNITLILVILFSSSQVHTQDQQAFATSLATKNLSYFLEWTERFIKEGEYLYDNPDSLLARYEFYIASLKSLGNDLAAFLALIKSVTADAGQYQRMFESGQGQYYDPEEMSILRFQIQTLKSRQQLIEDKYTRLSQVSNKKFSWLKTGFRHGFIPTIGLVSILFANRQLRNWYEWELSPDRNREFWQLTLITIPLSQHFYFGLGHYQGFSVGGHYRLLASWPLSKMVSPCEIYVSFILVINGKKDVNYLRKIAFGPSLRIRVYKVFFLTMGLYRQLYINKKDLPETPEKHQAMVPLFGLQLEF